jgi:branched-subunit amino acid transport protein
MCSVWRTRVRDRLGLDSDLARDIALVCLADGVVGLAFGAITVGAGLPIWLPMLLSVLVFAGAAQFLFVGIVASGGNPVAAALAGLLVNARHLPFGFAVADVLGRGWARKAVGSHVMIDESVAFVMAQSTPSRRRTAYWACGLSLFACWNVGVVVGALAGTVLSDTDALGLDAPGEGHTASGADRSRHRPPDVSVPAAGTARAPGADGDAAAWPFRAGRGCREGGAVVSASMTLVVAVIALGVGTFAFRFAGPLLRTRVRVSPRAERLLTVASVVLLTALVANAAVLQGDGFAGFARPAGVAVGGILAWRKAPFAVVVVAAAATAAILRLLGVP